MNTNKRNPRSTEVRDLTGDIGDRFRDPLLTIITYIKILRSELSDINPTSDVHMAITEIDIAIDKIREEVSELIAKQKEQEEKKASLLVKEAAEKLPINGKILYVDDEEVTRRVIKQELEMDKDTNFTVDCAHSGNEAIKMLSESDYDFVMCDVMMPDGNGVDVKEWLEQNKPELLVSGCFKFISGGMPNEWREAVGDDYIQRPHGVKEVIELIRDALIKKAKSTSPSCL